MTHRQRKSRRRRRRGGKSKFFLALVVLALTGTVARAVGDRLRAGGGRHRPGAGRAQADRQGRHLGDLRGRRLAPGLRPLGRDPRPGLLARAAREHAQRGRGHRGRALLQAQGRRLRRDRPRRRAQHRVRQERPGRLDHHPAAGPRAVHQGPGPQLRAQDPRGQAGQRAGEGALQALDPPQLPELGPLRDRRRPHRGGHRGRGPDLLLEVGEEPAPARVGPAGRPAPGAVAVQPVPQPERRAPAPQRGAAGHGQEPLHHARAGSRGLGEGPRREARPPLHRAPRALLLRLRRGEADRGVRGGRLPPRRAQGAHHDQPEAPGGRAQGDHRPARATTEDPSSAIVSIDPKTGYIKAMASSGTYNDRTFNLAAQGHRQPGSAFKTMVLTTAIRKGYNPKSTRYTSQPAEPQRARLRAVAGEDLRAAPTAAPWTWCRGR